MNIIMKRVDTLVPYERNAKKHDQKQVDNVAKSLEKFGWKQPLVVSDDGVVVVGHCRLLAAKQLGMEEAPCVVASDLTEEEIREYRIMDNKTNESPWERDVLALEIGEIDFDGFDLDFDMPAVDNQQYIDSFFDEQPADKPEKKKSGCVFVVTVPHERSDDFMDTLNEFGFAYEVK